MTDSAELGGLLGRVRAAMGADREIDDALAMALDGFLLEEMKPVYLTTVGRPQAIKDSPAPRYTSSLDAAIGLVERVRPGWWWKIWSAHGEPAFACIRGDGTPEFRQAGTTPALALLAALLASLQEDQPHG